MKMCDKCMGMSGLLLLVLGILFLLKDIGIWNFWGINWWTALFLVMGAVHLATKGCPECKKLRN